MGIGDKIQNAGQDAAGKAKEKIGDATDNQDLKSEGQADQVAAKAKKAGENVKDTFS